MIVQCPECQTKFEVSDSLIPEEGQKVRCAHCRHVWRQMPYVDISLAADEQLEDEIDFQSTLQSSFNEKTDALQSEGNIKYVNEEHEFDGPIKSFFITIFVLITNVFKAIFSRLRGIYIVLNSDRFTKATGFLMGMTLCLVIFIYSFIGLREDITVRFPSFYNIYSYLGYDVEPAGKNLLFENAHALWKHTDNGDPYLAIEGKIFNSSKETRHIPPVKITTLLATGVKGDSYSTIPKETIIEPDKRQEFSFSYPQKITDDSNLLLTLDVEALN